jgi:hypothetical protein
MTCSPKPCLSNLAHFEPAEGYAADGEATLEPTPSLPSPLLGGDPLSPCVPGTGAASPFSIVRNIPYVIDRRVGDRDGAAAAGGDVEVRRRIFPVLRQPAASSYFPAQN